jgi:choline dehydrogenase
LLRAESAVSVCVMSTGNTTESSYDVIVVGSGSAGGVLTRRLVDLGARVLLLEAGGADENPAIHDPAQVWDLWEGPEDWGYRTSPQAACAGRVLGLPRGKVLGGSSALNGMLYVRGHRRDFDLWAAAGNPGWSYDDVLPIFKRSEDFDQGADEYHGAGGPLFVLTRYEPHPVIAALVAATVEAGIPFNEDYNGAELEGANFGQLNIKNGRRHSIVEAFLRPVLDEPNLAVRTLATARRLLFEGSRCVGVEYTVDGELVRARADHEVVVCAGVIESPRLLLLSGLGPAADLRSLGIEPLVDLPGVGENLHDHVLVPLVYSAAKPVPPALPGLQQLHGQFFWHSRSGLDRPDLQPLFFHVPAYAEGMEGPPDGFSLMAGVIRPESRGSLRLSSADPDAPLLLDPAYLKEERDVQALLAAIELCREVAQQPAAAEWRGEELYPGPGVQTEQELRRYSCEQAITYHHQVGTCRMGVDELSVVDSTLRVRGVEGLRVADASIMPEVTTGNTHAATIMIGERAADLVAAGLSAGAASAVAPA